MVLQNPEQIKSELKAIIAKIAEVDQSKITDNAAFIEDLGMDSLMALEILSAVEKKYKINIHESNVRKMTTLSNVMDILRELQ